VKGGAWQARVWLPVGRTGYSLNLGLFVLADNEFKRGLTEWSAARASREFKVRWAGDRSIAEVVEELKGLGYVPESLVVPARLAGITARQMLTDELRRL